MSHDESWRQRFFNVEAPKRRSKVQVPKRPTERLAEQAVWNAPDDGVAHEPQWFTESGHEGEPEVPMCSMQCPWFMDRWTVRARARLAGASRRVRCEARCMHPLHEGANTEDYKGWCWPAYIDIWRRACGLENE